MEVDDLIVDIENGIEKLRNEFSDSHFCGSIFLTTMMTIQVLIRHFCLTIWTQDASVFGHSEKILKIIEI